MVCLYNVICTIIEPEIIFELTADLPEDADTQTILESVKIAPGIEIPDARYKDWFPNFTLGDLISDNTLLDLLWLVNVSHLLITRHLSILI